LVVPEKDQLQILVLKSFDGHLYAVISYDLRRVGFITVRESPGSGALPYRCSACGRVPELVEGEGEVLEQVCPVVSVDCYGRKRPGTVKLFNCKLLGRWFRFGLGVWIFF